MKIRSHRILIATVTIGLAIPAAAAGGSILLSDGPPGSPDNPLSAPLPDPHTVAAAEAKGHFNEARPPSAQDGREEALSHKPCQLVSANDAGAILGGAVTQPKEAPLGPTCVYRTDATEDFVTVALQTLDGAQLQATVKDLERSQVAGKDGYCLQSAASTLYVQLSGSRVLIVGAPECDVAKKFAVKAIAAVAR